METTISTCAKCGTKYHVHKSGAELRYTYCNSICQKNDMGGVTADILDFLDSLSLARSLKSLTKEVADVV